MGSPRAGSSSAGVAGPPRRAWSAAVSRVLWWRRSVLCTWAVAGPEAISAARAALRRALAGLGLRDESIGDAVLAVSELVANAGVHARGPYELRVRRTAVGVVCEVRDRDSRIPRTRPRVGGGLLVQGWRPWGMGSGSRRRSWPRAGGGWGSSTTCRMVAGGSDGDSSGARSPGWSSRFVDRGEHPRGAITDPGEGSAVPGFVRWVIAGGRGPLRCRTVRRPTGATVRARGTPLSRTPPVRLSLRAWVGL